MAKLPESIRRLIENLSELPSIGPRQATRLVFYLTGRGENFTRTLAKDLNDLSNIKICERCFFVHDQPGRLCDICGNPNRDQGTILIVEKETDLLSIEKTGKFHGRYFVTGQMPKAGVLADWQKLRLQSLKRVIQNSAPGGLGGKAEEVIIGFNPTSLGDFHASLLVKELAPFVKKLSRLGRGLPTGGEVEFADDETLGSAIERRD